jgi:hypothetical protein
MPDKIARRAAHHGQNGDRLDDPDQKIAESEKPVIKHQLGFIARRADIEKSSSEIAPEDRHKSSDKNRRRGDRYKGPEIFPVKTNRAVDQIACAERCEGVKIVVVFRQHNGSKTAVSILSKIPSIKAK